MRARTSRSRCCTCSTTTAAGSPARTGSRPAARWRRSASRRPPTGRGRSRGGAARDVDGLEIGTTGGARVTRATVLPVARLGAPAPAAVLVLGVNPRRPLDDDYRDFFGLIARQVSSALGGAEGFEAERARADQLAELDKAKTEFFSNVSHEFRTPLMLMLGPLTDAVDDPGADPAVQRERIAIANRGALRLLRLVNALLDFSRLEAGRSTRGVRARRPAAASSTETAAVFRAAAERSGLELRVDVPEGELHDRGRPGDAREDPPQPALERVQVHVRGRDRRPRAARRAGGRDRGRRHAASASRPPISRACSSASIASRAPPGRSHEGSGIGLALVSELVELHGGQVGVESRPGRGRTFRVELPLTPARRRRAAAGALAARGRPPRRLRRGGAALARRADDRARAADRRRGRAARGRRQRRPARRTSRGCSATATRCAPPSTAWTRSSSCASARPTSCSPT